MIVIDRLTEQEVGFLRDALGREMVIARVQGAEDHAHQLEELRTLLGEQNIQVKVEYTVPCEGQSALDIPEG